MTDPRSSQQRPHLAGRGSQGQSTKIGVFDTIWYFLQMRVCLRRQAEVNRHIQSLRQVRNQELGKDLLSLTPLDM